MTITQELHEGKSKWDFIDQLALAARNLTISALQTVVCGRTTGVVDPISRPRGLAPIRNLPHGCPPKQGMIREINNKERACRRSITPNGGRLLHGMLIN